MPELPEVETVARQLAEIVVGRRARRLAIFDPKLAGSARDDLGARLIAGVFRRGKQVLFEFAGAGEPTGKPEWLAVHLRMTGRLVFAEHNVARPHLRAALELERGVVQLIDPRRFGTLTWTPTPAAAAPAGLDPTSPGFTPATLAGLLAGSRQPIKPWLLRQDRVVGLGNIYASEILHRARVSPLRRAQTLTRAEIARLHRATRRTLDLAIKWNGTTFSDFQDAHGATGGFLRFLLVYDREGRPCRRCGGPVRRIVQQQRSTYYCPTCVKRKSGRSGERNR